ncbi:MAG: hypothetical protein AB1750_21025 [Chloroflexota bacterium]
MKKTKFTLYGLLIGAVCAVYGSAIIALLVTLIYYGSRIFSAFWPDILMLILIVIFFSVMYSIVPGAVGGLYLARWIGQSERTPEEIRQRGLIVGAAAGVAVSAFVASVILQFNMDALMTAYALLAILVSAGMSWLAASLLAKDRKKFITSNPLP